MSIKSVLTATLISFTVVIAPNAQAQFFGYDGQGAGSGGGASSGGIFGKGMNFKLSGHGIYETAQLALVTGGKANFSGTGFGGTAELRSVSRGYAIGFRLGYDATTLQNSANTAAASETLAMSNWSLMPRIYALNLFVGLGLAIVNAEHDSIVAGVNTTDQLSGLSYRAELGFDWYLGRSFLITPMVSYTRGKVVLDSSTSKLSLSQFGLYLGIGFDF